MAKQPSAVQVPGISDRIILRSAHLKGQVRLDFTPVKHAWEYEIEVGESSDDGSIVWEDRYTSTSSQGIVLAPFMSGIEVYVRVRARNGKGIGDWSKYASIVVH